MSIDVKRTLIMHAILIVAAFKVPATSVAENDPSTALVGNWVEGEGQCLVANIGTEEAQEIALARAREDAARKVLGEKIQVEKGQVLLETPQGSQNYSISLRLSRLYGDIIEEEQAPIWTIGSTQTGAGGPPIPSYRVTLRARVVRGATGTKADSILRGIADALWRPLSPSKATLASMLFPGTGQLINKRKSGYAFLTAGLASSIGVGLTWIRLDNALDEQYDAMKKSEYERLGGTVRERRRVRNTALGIAATIWLMNSVDSYFESRSANHTYKHLVRHLGGHFIKRGFITEDGTSVRFLSEYE